MPDEVVVNVEGEETPPADGGDTVVIHDGGESGNTDAVVEMAGRVGALEARIEEMSNRLSEVESRAVVAEAVAEVAVEAASEAVEAADEAEQAAEEAAEEEPVPTHDEPPNREHPFFRKVTVGRGES